MAKFSDLLKDLENAGRVGFKNGAWFPHKSAEGGTRTLGYGHKLSPKEEKGNFVELPDGSIVDFDNRGLTDQEIDSLFQQDQQKALNVAKTQWNQYQKVDFNSLSDLDQTLLSEIVFNIGTLKSGDGKNKFGWPSLAKGMINNEPDVIKDEIMRSFTDSKGNKKPLTARVNKIRDFIDGNLSDPQQFEADIVPQQTQQPSNPQQSTQSSDERLQGVLSRLDQVLRPTSKTSERASQEVSEQFTEEEQSFINSIVGSNNVQQNSGINKRDRAEDEARLERTFNEANLQEEAEKTERFSKGQSSDREFTPEEERLIASVTATERSERKQPMERDDDRQAELIQRIF